MKTLIINGSPRKNGCTITLINQLKQHLHGEISQINTYYAESSPCYDCRYCFTNAECKIKDEMIESYRMIDEADNFVIASPIYFGNLTGSLLNWASRLQLFWVSRNIRKVEPISMKQRKGAVILVCGSDKGIEPAIFSGKDLLLKAKAECCDILDIRMAEVDHKPVLTNEHAQKIENLAKILNERK